jgi:uncharacterized membrane protein
MKILKNLQFVIFVFILSLGNFSVARASEEIKNFEVNININSDASISVKESIEYDFDTSTRHGIYRDIPFKYDARGGKYNLRISNISVTDHLGSPYDFTVSNKGDYKSIQIGNAKESVSGTKIYIIQYEVAKAINYFASSDELYWNVTGNEWIVPIRRARVSVFLPKDVPYNSLNASCFSGYSGGRATCDSISYGENDGYIGSAIFSEENLDVNEGLTFALAFPKGLVYQPTSSEKFMEAVWDNLIILFPLLVFLIMFSIWRNKGKDPKGRGTIVTEFDVPDQLTPAEVGTIVDEKCAGKEISGEIINLAVKGYLKIERVENKILFVKKVDYVFKKLKEGEDLGNKHEKFLFSGIFGDKGEIKLSEIKDDFYDDYQLVKKRIYEAVSQKGYFFHSPQRMRLESFAKYSFLMFILFYAFSFFAKITFDAYSISSLCLAFLIIFIFSIFMPQRTSRGVMAKEHILGFKRYLSVAEKDRMDFHNAPEKSPEQFEKFLPFAVALGVEKKWAEQFKDIYRSNPAWYGGSMGSDGFNSMALIYNLDGLNSQLNEVTTHSSASSGGSGFSGGGFSGGGFGGGGGGSW